MYRRRPKYPLYFARILHPRRTYASPPAYLLPSSCSLFAFLNGAEEPRVRPSRGLVSRALVCFREWLLINAIHWARSKTRTAGSIESQLRSSPLPYLVDQLFTSVSFHARFLPHVLLCYSSYHRPHIYSHSTRFLSFIVEGVSGINGLHPAHSSLTSWWAPRTIRNNDQIREHGPISSIVRTGCYELFKNLEFFPTRRVTNHSRDISFGVNLFFWKNYLSERNICPTMTFLYH